VNRIAWLIEIDGLVVSYELHIEDKAVWFVAIRAGWFLEYHLLGRMVYIVCKSAGPA